MKTKELTQHERNIITKYDLYYEGRLTKSEAQIDELKKLTKEIRDDFKIITQKIDKNFLWLLTFTIGAWGSLAGLILHLHRIIP